jgi:hypothetical protein
VKIYEIDNFILTNFRWKVKATVIRDKLVDLLVANTKLSLHGVSATDLAEEVVTLKGATLCQPLSQHLDLHFRLADELEHLVGGLHEEFLDTGVVPDTLLEQDRLWGLMPLLV